MTPENRLRLKNLLVKHESYRQYPYSDTGGHLTIGIGRNLSDRGISSSEALSLLDNDILYFSSKLSILVPVFNTLDDNRKIVMVDMCFNLGINGFLEFKEMLEALGEGKYDVASECMLQSKWADQVGQRAIDDAYIMRTGEFS